MRQSAGPHTLCRDILNALYLSGGSSDASGLRSRLGRLRDIPSRPGWRGTLSRLRARKWIFRWSRDGTTWIRLTRRGLIRTALRPASTDAPPAPEGLHYFVTYDVPATLNDVRDRFRSVLRTQGWQRLHHSLWISSCDIRNTAVDAAEELGIGPCVFVGTGALATPVTRPLVEDRARAARESAVRIAGEAASDVRSAYRLWAVLTDHLRSDAARALLDGDVRDAGEQATHKLTLALRRAESEARQ